MSKPKVFTLKIAAVDPENNDRLYICLGDITELIEQEFGIECVIDEVIE